MLQSIEIEIDANGCIHSLEPLPVGRRGILTLFEESSLENPAQTGIGQQSKQSHFEDLFGILTAKRSVSLEEINLICDKA
jgi:hypothetical protein